MLKFRFSCFVRVKSQFAITSTAPVFRGDHSRIDGLP
jgi:hypothetical protein